MHNQSEKSEMPLNGSVTKWTSNEVKEWLIKNGFNNYSHLLCDVHKINGTSLLMLTEEDLKNPPLKIEVRFWKTNFPF